MSLPLGVLINAEHPVSDVAAIATSCELLGYERFWYTDLRLASDCYIGLAAVAARTSRIAIGPGVTDPYIRHPAVTAASIATLDELSGGRALLGLGIGSGLAPLGIERRLPVAALREAITVVRGLLDGGEVTLDGKVVTLRGERLRFRPTRRDVPIYVATHGRQVTRLAGQLANGVLFANILVPEALDQYLGMLRAGVEHASRTDPVDVSLRFEVCLSSDRPAAMEVMRRRVASRLLSQYPHWEYLESLGVSLPPEFETMAARRDPSQLGAAMAVLPDEALHRTVLVGSPDEVAERIARVLRPEVRSITIRPHAVPGDSVVDVVRSFAEDVMPRVRS